MRSKNMTSQQGFSLLEVIITIAILVSLTVAVAIMLRASVDVKQGLAENARVTHRLSIAMQKIATDIEHVYIVNKNDNTRLGATRLYKTVFRIDKGESDKIFMTTTSHQAVLANRNESDLAYVVYEVKDDPETPGRKSLYRGELPAFIEDLKTEPPMRVIAQNIKGMHVIPWKGDDWSRDRWDSNRSEWSNKIPRMVRIEIESWANDPLPGEALSESDQQGGTADVKTVVFLAASRGIPELKSASNSFRWF